MHPSQEYVNLHYRTPENYRDGVISKQYDHLQVFSTGAFKVMAEKSDGINDEVVTIIPDSESSKPLYGTTMNTVSLTESPQNLILSEKSAYDHTYSITYKGVGAYNYADHLHGANPKEYRTVVTYTIMPE